MAQRIIYQVRHRPAGDQPEGQYHAWRSGFAADDSIGVLEYVNDAGETVREELKPEIGDYGRVYDALYATLTAGADNYVKESDVLTNLEILERAFEQASPATVTLAK
jgi:hypothetical protein